MAKDADLGNASRPPSPAELMRAWHPDLFSDSQRVNAPAVPRAVLDHHLETLTNRKEEDEFEYFARLLAEREICPNLRPQTGPTGGGDSKVDTETYPVAQDIAMRWYYGEPEAASERWAFAFSAKKKWRDKVKADVESILSTGRPYKRIYFITNQYAPEKSRASAEDSLTQLAGVPVTILDRSWILEKVYANGLLELAVRALNMTGFTELVNERAGPLDTARQAELARLDEAVADPARYNGARYALAEDALQSALLARGLERPRSEVEGRLLAAARIAEDVGHSGQRLRVAYNRAWTAYWWFDDPGSLNEQYEIVAEIALASDEAANLEQLLTLWQLLVPAVQRGTLTVEKARIEARGIALHDALERVAAIRERPNNAAHARTFLLVMKMSRLMQEQRYDQLDAIWQELGAVLSKVEGLGDYPLERVHELITRVGEVVPESDAFDTLFDNLVAVIERRRSEAEGGLAYLRRGGQKLDKGLPYDAIRMFGRAEIRLIKAEYLDELVETLVGIGQAYRQAGLNWAARAKGLIAADKLLSSFGHTGTIDPRAVVPIKLLAWIELELGRIPQALGAITFYRMLANLPDQPIAIAEKVVGNLELLEAILGMLLMRADLDQLRALEQLPDTLEGEGLVLARGALLWALAGAQAVRDDGFAPEGQSDDEIAEFFDLWARQPAAAQIPLRPILAEGSSTALKTIVLGVEVVAEVASEPDSIFLGEAILAALECFLATSLSADVFPFRERLTFTVAPAPEPNAKPTFEVNELTGSISITHGAGGLAGAPDYPTFTSWLQDLLVHLSLGMFMIRDTEAWLRQVASDEVGFGRALALSAVGIATRNVFGEAPRVLISDWIDPTSVRYGLERDAALPLPADVMTVTDKHEEPLRYGQGEPPEKFDPEAGTHSDRRVLSPINIPLWNRAKWRATGFGWTEKPPLLMFAFADYAAGEAIFHEWLERYGSVDVKDALRIAIIRGVDRDNPTAYKVHVSTEISAAEAPGTMFYSASRINQMTPQSSFNLDQFLAAYAAKGTYLLAPMPFQAVDGFQAVDPRLAIFKRKLIVREAWQIDENDPDIPCLDLEDMPVIPDHVADAPVIRALERLRKKRDRTRGA